LSFHVSTEKPNPLPGLKCLLALLLVKKEDPASNPYGIDTFPTDTLLHELKPE
jgi:hypothetical protein